MEKDFTRKVNQATKWSSITEIGTKLIAPVTNTILARLLAPEAFGVVATLTMVITFAEIFTDAGFQKYLVQHEFPNEDDLNASTNVAFWTNLLFSLGLWGIIALFATPIARVVGSEGHETAIVVISAEIPLLAFSSIQMARFRRDFDYKKLFFVRLAVACVPLAITVPMALLLHNYWALVAGTLAKDVLNAVVLTVRSKWKPSLQFDFAKLKEMMSFSIWTVVENVTIWLTTNIGTLIVVTLLGTYYVGLYKTTITTVGGYFGILQSATMPVLFAALSRCQNDQVEFRNIMQKFQRMMSMLVLPLGFGMLTYRRLVTDILLGSQWYETADYVGIYALSTALVFIFSYYNSEAFRSKGRPMLSVLAQIIYLVVLIPALWFSARIGYKEMTVWSVLARMTLILATSVIAHATLKIHILDSIRNVWPPLLSSVVMAGAGIALRSMHPSLLWEITTVLLCVLVYGLCMLAIPAGRKQLLEIPVMKKILQCCCKKS